MAEKQPEKSNTNEPKEEKQVILPDPKFETMTRDEAMEYFDLPVWAKREDLDDRFWKLGKTYRAQKDEQKLADLSAAYNIATGNRDRIIEEKKEEENTKHYFGKTKKQWGDFFHYEGWKFVVAFAVLVFAIAFAKVFIFAPRLDIRVTGVGHFDLDESRLNNVVTDYSSFKNPEVDYVDVVSDNDEGEEVDTLALQREMTLLAVYPTVLILDSYTAPSYVSGETLLPLDDIYDEMKRTWTAEELSHIEPYIYSRAQFVRDYGDKILAGGAELPEEGEDDETEHVYGFIIRDRIDQLALGFKVKWKESDSSIVIGINAGGEKIDKAKEMEKAFLKDLENIRAQYLEEYPYIEAND